MKVFISVDMEGITGVAHWPHVMSKEQDYKEAREQMIADTNAAIEGALDAGADEIIVNDAHDRMGNLLLSKLNSKARLISGFVKPLGMMQGVEGADAALFVGYHARMGTLQAVLDHTLNGSSIISIHLNGIEVGEPELNASLAGHFEVPVVFLSGDEAMCRLARDFIGGWVETAVVKTAIGRGAAECLHPEVTKELIKDGVKKALSKLSEAQPVRVEMPVRIDIELASTEMADMASVCPSAERVDGRTIAVAGKTVLEAYFALKAVAALGIVPMALRRL